MVYLVDAKEVLDTLAVDEPVSSVEGSCLFHPLRGLRQVTSMLNKGKREREGRGKFRYFTVLSSLKQEATLPVSYRVSQLDVLRPY